MKRRMSAITAPAIRIGMAMSPPTARRSGPPAARRRCRFALVEGGGRTVQTPRNENAGEAAHVAGHARPPQRSAAHTSRVVRFAKLRRGDRARPRPNTLSAGPALLRHPRALLARLRQTDRDRLLAALHSSSAAPALERASLAPAHCARHGLGC